MIYERWFTVKDANGLDYLYYSDIRKTPFLNAVKHQNKAYKSMLEKRMYRLLKKDVSIELNFQNLIAGLPVSFTMYYRGLPIVEYGGNYIDLNGIRNEVFLIDEYDIRKIVTGINDNGETVKVIHVQDKEYCIPVQRRITETSSGRRNFLTIDEDLMNAVIGQRFVTGGKGINEKEVLPVC